MKNDETCLFGGTPFSDAPQNRCKNISSKIHPVSSPDPQYPRCLLISSQNPPTNSRRWIGCRSSRIKWTPSLPWAPRSAWDRGRFVAWPMHLTRTSGARIGCGRNEANNRIFAGEKYGKLWRPVDIPKKTQEIAGNRWTLWKFVAHLHILMVKLMVSCI